MIPVVYGLALLQIAPPAPISGSLETGGMTAAAVAIVLAIAQALKYIVGRANKDRADNEAAEARAAQAAVIETAVRGGTEASRSAAVEAAKVAIKESLEHIPSEVARVAVRKALDIAASGDPECIRQMQTLLKDFLHEQELRDVRAQGGVQALSDILGSQERLIKSVAENTAKQKALQERLGRVLGELEKFNA